MVTVITDMEMETVLDDVLQLIAESQRQTTRWQLVRDRHEDRGIIRSQLRIDALSEARAQYRRNENRARFNRKSLTDFNVVASMSSRLTASSVEEAADHLLTAYADRKTKTRGRKLITKDPELEPELVRALLRQELEKFKRDNPKKAKRSKSISKGMR